MVIITLSVLAVVLILLMILARRWDLKDLRKISVIPLCGKDGPFKYEVTVTTGGRKGAGKILYMFGVYMYVCMYTVTV